MRRKSPRLHLDFIVFNVLSTFMLPIHRYQTSVFNYDEIPAGYYYQAMVSGSATQRFWHRKKFSRVADFVRDGETVLDLGCGPGSFLSILAERYPSVRA